MKETTWNKLHRQNPEFFLYKSPLAGEGHILCPPHYRFVKKIIDNDMDRPLFIFYCDMSKFCPNL